MDAIELNEMMLIEGGSSGWVAFLAGGGTAVGCLASGGAELGPLGWGGCALAGVFVGVGTYIL